MKITNTKSNTKKTVESSSSSKSNFLLFITWLTFYFCTNNILEVVTKSPPLGGLAAIYQFPDIT